MLPTRKSQRRRGEPQQKKRYRKRAAQALAAGAVIAGGTQAYATPIRHDNPSGAGHFDWTATVGQDVLSVLDDASSQPGVLGVIGAFEISSDYGRILIPGAASNPQQVDAGGYQFLQGVSEGELIPTAGQFFKGAAYIYSTYPYAPVPTLLPEGTATYLGVRFDLGSGNQYGWIGVVRTGLELDAFAWGYETEPGMPIPAGAPEPGTLAMLALGATALVCRRRNPNQGA